MVGCGGCCVVRQYQVPLLPTVYRGSCWQLLTGNWDTRSSGRFLLPLTGTGTGTRYQVPTADGKQIYTTVIPFWGLPGRPNVVYGMAVSFISFSSCSQTYQYGEWRVPHMNLLTVPGTRVLIVLHTNRNVNAAR